MQAVEEGCIEDTVVTGDESKPRHNEVPPVPYLQLYSKSDWLDKLAVLVATIAAAADGVYRPVLCTSTNPRCSARCTPPA
jgi:hypothetical protein